MAAPSVDDLGRSFERYLRAGNRSPRTIETYLEAVAGFTGFLSAISRRSLDEALREDVEAWIGALLARWKPSTAHNRYRGTPSTERECGELRICDEYLQQREQAVQLINLERHDLELDPTWREHLRARTVVAPGLAAIDLGLRVARSVVTSR